MSAGGRGCRLCGHQCGVDRSAGAVGRCGAGSRIGFSSAVVHPGEEPPLSGPRGPETPPGPTAVYGPSGPSGPPVQPGGGSGTIFLTRCNLACVFCQNWQISQATGRGGDVDVDELVDVMFWLRDGGAHNINLVSPTPYVNELALAVSRARRRGLDLPVVYNSGGYDSPEALAMMDGLVDVYLPDAKLGMEPGRDPSEPDPRSMRLFGARDYVLHNRAALKEMLRQVGHLVLDGRGLASRGLIVRHLVLPDDLARTTSLLPWLADNLGQSLHLSLMAQYHPANKIVLGDNPEYRDLPGLGRPLSVREYEDCMDLAWRLDLKNTFVQDLAAATGMRPDFDKPEVFN